MKKAKQTIAAMGADAFLAAIARPAGFTSVRADEKLGWGKDDDALTPVLRITGDGITVDIQVHDIHAKFGPASGHVSFTSALGDRTLDRRGVEDSFYVEGDDTPAMVGAKVREQLERVAESRTRLARSQPVPSIPFTVTPERKAEVNGAAPVRQGCGVRAVRVRHRLQSDDAAAVSVRPPREA